MLPVLRGLVALADHSEDELWVHHNIRKTGHQTKRVGLGEFRHALGMDWSRSNAGQLTADQAFTLLKRRSQNTNVTLRAVAQTVIQTGDLPVCRGK